MSTDDPSSSVAPLTTKEQDDILKARLSADEKYIRRIAKRLSSLVQASSADEHEALTLLLKSDLQMFERHIERLRASASVTSDYDIQTYNEEAKALMKQCEQEKEKISELKQVLNEAQQDRQHKVEYNEIARKILVYPSRDDMEMTLQELKDKITTLQTDIAKYDEASSQARNGLQDVSGIVQRLHGDVRASLGMKPLLVENVAESQAASTSLDPAAPSFTPTSQPAGKRDHSDSKESDASTQTLSPSKEAQPAKRTKTSKGSSST